MACCCCCSGRAFMIGVCVLQLVLTAFRQLFDFLGYMWAPILANFFNFLFVILGLFGIYQYRPRYVLTYVIWTLAWVIWNVFCICFYLELGFLSRELNYLNLGTGSRSWFEINGLGCKAMFDPHTPDELAGFTKPASVDGCLVDYYYVETAQAGIQVFLGLLAIIGGSFVIYHYTQEDPSSARRKGLWGHLGPLHRSTASLPYSIEYHHVGHPLTNAVSPSTAATLHVKSSTLGGSSSANSSQRRKRRSVRSHRASQHRASYQNPVTRLIDRYVDTSSQDSYNHLTEYLKATNGALSAKSPVHLYYHHQQQQQQQLLLQQQQQQQTQRISPTTVPSNSGLQVQPSSAAGSFVEDGNRGLLGASLQHTEPLAATGDAVSPAMPTSDRAPPFRHLLASDAAPLSSSTALSTSAIGGQVNQAYENRYSIASSGTYGVVENVPCPAHLPQSGDRAPQFSAKTIHSLANFTLSSSSSLSMLPSTQLLSPTTTQDHLQQQQTAHLYHPASSRLQFPPPPDDSETNM